MTSRDHRLVVRYEGPVGTVHRSMIKALQSDLYEAVLGERCDDEEGFMLMPRPSGREDPHPIPCISFRIMTAPMLPPHDPIAIALMLLEAPRVHRTEADRVRSALKASACANGFVEDPDRNRLILTMCASPWNAFRMSEAKGTVDDFVRIDVPHDGLVEDLLPMVADSSYSGSSLDPAHGRFLSFMPLAAHVDKGGMMDPMQSIRAIADLQRNPLQAMTA